MHDTRENRHTEASTASARPGTDTCTKKANSPLTDSQPYIFRAIEGLAVEFAVRAPPPPLPSPLHYTPSLTLSLAHDPPDPQYPMSPHLEHSASTLSPYPHITSPSPPVDP